MLRDKLEKQKQNTISYGELCVGTSVTGQNMDIPYIMVKGKNAQPTLWINGQVHGDEINGVVTALEVAQSIDPNELVGSVIITPSGNPLALYNRTKRAPQDLQDLDQTFPGSASGFLTERVAAKLLEEIVETASLVINMHSVTPGFQAKSYVVYKDVSGCQISEEELLNLINCFSPSVACKLNVESSDELPGNVPGAMDWQCIKRGIPAFMVEIGWGAWCNPEDISVAVDGCFKLMRSLGVMQGEPNTERKAIRKVTKREWIRADWGGLFRSNLEPGDIVEKGELIGTILSLRGGHKYEIHAKNRMHIVMIRRNPVVDTGDPIAFAADEWEDI